MSYSDKIQEIEHKMDELLEEMDSETFDASMERDLKDKLIGECESNDEHTSIRVYFELFRVIDILRTMYIHDSYLDYRIIDLAARMCFLNYEILKDLYFNKYNEVFKRAVRKRII